ncbi:hypothetical protein K431DRAFT_38187 [Polychaeton citri CBS 116435]|uniref:Uncharacterized protein n=1 Tax=Polychaeton citri CBS 116435 TaxID=1314669 RepID=A0A9P4QDJ6_9PEZI|nr:hypothetical protein K431DRAFT_38187 [Polychaeton citri CBS 116435]
MRSCFARLNRQRRRRLRSREGEGVQIGSPDHTRVQGVACSHPRMAARHWRLPCRSCLLMLDVHLTLRTIHLRLNALVSNNSRRYYPRLASLSAILLIRRAGSFSLAINGHIAATIDRDVHYWILLPMQMVDGISASSSSSRAIVLRFPPPAYPKSSSCPAHPLRAPPIQSRRTINPPP